MKRIIISIIFVLSITTNLLAYKNSYFKVDDEGLKSNSLFGAYVFALDLKENYDYDLRDQKRLNPPTITIIVLPNKGNYPSYNKSNAEKFGKEYLNGLNRSSYKQIDDYKLDKSSIGKFGKNQAFCFEISNSSFEIRSYMIVSEKYIYTIAAKSAKGDNFKVTDAYQRFEKSFEILDAMPKSGFKRFFSSLFSGGSDSTNPVTKYRFFKELFLLTLFIVIFIARKIINSN